MPDSRLTESRRRYKIEMLCLCGVISSYLDGLKIMQKNTLTIPAATLVMGIFGAFLRWLQSMIIFEETGLVTPGETISVVYTVYSLLAAAAMVCIARIWKKRFACPTDVSTALHVCSALPTAITWGFCVICGIAALVLMFTAGSAHYPTMQRCFGAAGIVAAACFPALPIRQGEGASARTGAAYLPLFFCYWLVLLYRTDAENPVLWAYAPEILAVAAGTMAFYYVAAYFYGRARPAAALLFLQLSAFLNLCVAFDTMSVAHKALFLVTAGMSLLLEYLLVSNAPEATDTDIA